MKVRSMEPSHLWGEMTFAPTLYAHCSLCFDAGVPCCSEAWWQPQSRVIRESEELGFCAYVEERWTEDASQCGHASGLRKWVFASELSSPRMPRALVLPWFLCLCLHDFLT